MNKIRFFDLFVFTILMLLSEFLSSYFFKKMSSGFYLSFASMLFIILSIRWGVTAIIPFIISGVPLIFTQNIGYLDGFLYYCMGNLLAIVPIIFFGRKDRNKVVESPLKTVIYVLSVLIFLSIGKGLVIWILNSDSKGFVEYLISMIFTFVINTILILLFNKYSPNLACDMNQYYYKNSEEYQEKMKKNEEGASSE